MHDLSPRSDDGGHPEQTFPMGIHMFTRNGRSWTGEHIDGVLEKKNIRTVSNGVLTNIVKPLI